MTQLLHPGTDEVLGDLKIVDCDAHITEPADLWTSRVPHASPCDGSQTPDG